MAIFIIEIMNAQMQIEDKYTMELPVETVEQAMMTTKVIKLKKEAKAQNMGFRVRRL